MKTIHDNLQQEVLDELRWEPSIGEGGIGVSVSGDTVTLSGHVRSYAEKRTAEKAALRVRGVSAVANELEVRLPSDLRVDDTDIASAAISALKWHTSLPADTVKLTAERGWLTLTGEVDWEYQKRAAEKAIRDLRGVKGVSNHIRVKPAVRADQVQNKIRAAFHRSAQIDADHVAVTVKGSDVTLSGTVHSWAEKKEAEYAAWSAPGVTAVHNHLHVAPQYATAIL
jgi:osmotically-inducible protein OsmY